MHNDEMNLAWRFVEGTDVSVFLTGKAGTGKTTFLRKLKELAPKRMTVVAPTGVAAINARGTTIHSLFQLSPGVHVPGMTEAQGKSRFFQMSKEKKNILRTLDLLVIDEISMVRCDLLDAIDGVLRKYKDRNRPFGGVQLLLIGDLQQLAPVATDQEWSLLAPYYDTPYFFSSKALQQIQYVTIELKHVYRQSDSNFVDLLGKIRDNRIDQDVMQTLGARYVPHFQPPAGEGWIRLTTHNYMAQRYNETQLAMIGETLQSYAAEVTGNFPESSYPAEKMLGLKVGAQVMFLKNDPSGQQQYYNGKIGTVVRLTPDEVWVQCPDESKAICVPQLEWENMRYAIDPETKEIKEEVDGTFKQFPLQLAWAITIHKSQGLTFDHAVLDINRSFAHGQVYVALSRCRTLEGLVLANPLHLESLAVDNQVDAFIAKELEAAKTASSKLDEMRFAYFRSLLGELFGFGRLAADFNYFLRVVDEHLYHQQPDYLLLLKGTRETFLKQVLDVADKFQPQYYGILQQIRAGETPDQYAKDAHLQERVKAAANYFHSQLLALFAPAINKAKFTIGNQQVKKQFGNALDALTLEYRTKMASLRCCAESGFEVKMYLKSKAAALVETDAPTVRKTGRKKGTTAAVVEARRAAKKAAADESVLASKLGLPPMEHDHPIEEKDTSTEKPKPQWKWYWNKRK